METQRAVIGMHAVIVSPYLDCLQQLKLGFEANGFEANGWILEPRASIRYPPFQSNKHISVPKDFHKRVHF